MLYIDLTELILYARFSDVVSGIQRVVYNLAKEAQDDQDVGFVVFPEGRGRAIRILDLSFDDTGDIRKFNLLNDNWRASKLKWSYTRRRVRDRRGLHKLTPVMRYLASHLIRPLLKNEVVDFKGMKVSWMSPEDFHEGDVLVVPSFPQNASIFRLHLHQIRSKVKFVFFYHDIIPLTAKEFVGGNDYDNFKIYFEMMLEYADLLLTSAQFNVKDFLKYAAKEYPGRKVPPIHAIGLPVEFTAKVTEKNFYSISPVARKLCHYRYCLCVGSVGPRKNHFELLQAWKKFYDSDAYNNELLVIAGTPWATSPDIVDLIRNRAFCGASVIFIESPSDVELAYLYQHCRFTACLSLYEGWGLPVSESIAVGKPVVILDETTLPEAGYGVANIVHGRNLRDMQNMIARLFGDEAYYQQSIEKILKKQKELPTWAKFKDKFKHAIIGDSKEAL